MTQIDFHPPECSLTSLLKYLDSSHSCVNYLKMQNISLEFKISPPGEMNRTEQRKAENVKIKTTKR